MMTSKSETSKVILDWAITLDGFIEGENGEVDWCIMDPEMSFTTFLNQIDTIFYGRKSYDLWGQFTPTNDATEDEKEMWDIIHSKVKYVFSKSQTYPEENVHVISEDISKTVNRLKQASTKNLWLYGGSSLITTFIELNLIDEYRLSIHPVVLGSGKPLFDDLKHRLNLTLIETNTFTSGVVQLIYRTH